MPQVTRAEPGEAKVSTASPIRGDNGDFLRIKQYGLHTFSLAYREGDVVKLERCFCSQTFDSETGEKVFLGSGYGGSHKWLRHLGSGLRLDLKHHPRGHLLTASGEAFSVLAEDQRADGLVLIDRLVELEESVRDQMRRMGVSLPHNAILRVHRADLATDLAFDDARGVDVLRAFSSLPLARHETETRAVAGSPALFKWVKWRRSDKVQLLVYDRGRKRGTAAPGELLRLERRYRPECREQVAVRDFAARDHATTYASPLGDYETAQVVVVPTWAAADEELQSRCRSDATALSGLGALVRLHHRGREAFPDADAARRRLRALRQSGVVHGDHLSETIRLGIVIDAFVDPWRAA